ncbi:MAG: acyl-homoserine-lactone synthase [Halioglobus sp.]
MKLSIGQFSFIPEGLLQPTFSDRYSQFVERLSWQLPQQEVGREIDQYDDPHTTYIIVEDKGTHLASCRIREFGHSTMLTDHFSHIFPEVHDLFDGQPGRFFELTRLCKSRDLGPRDSFEALGLLGNALDYIKFDTMAEGFVAIVYRTVTRLLKLRGVRFLILSRSQIDSKNVDLLLLLNFAGASNLSFKEVAVLRGQFDFWQTPTVDENGNFKDARE